MKIVFITSRYHPYFSANGKCVFNLVSELEKEHEVIVVSDMPVDILPYEEMYQNHKIIRVRSNLMKKRDRVMANLHNSSCILKKWYHINLMMIRFIGFVRIILSKYSIQIELVNEFFTALSGLKDVDLIIPTCFPFESILAAEKYKSLHKNDIMIRPMLYDKFSDSSTLHRSILNKKLKFKSNLRLEHNIIREAQKIYIVDSWVRHIDKYFHEYKQNIIKVEHPLLVEYSQSQHIKIFGDMFFNIVFTGSLVKKMRPPDLVLDILSKVIQLESRVKVHFYILGNCDSIVNRYCRIYPDNIFNHGYVESRKASSIIYQSDILLSLGNKDIELIPSKIFEYMSVGKPIIHFYFFEDDPIIEILNKYNLAICLKQTYKPNKDYINKLVLFIREVIGSKRQFNDVQNDFIEATPKFIANTIINI